MILGTVPKCTRGGSGDGVAPFSIVIATLEGTVAEKGERLNVLVSQCLLGAPCRYDGGSKSCDAVRRLLAQPGVRAIPVCPETDGGLVSPRPPAEQRGARVVLETGEDVTQAFLAGATRAVERAQAAGADLCILKAKSPSCGCGQVYDGSFSGRLVPGDGIAAARIKRKGFPVHTENEVEVVHPSMEHPVAISLGSGLGYLAQLVKPVRRIPYADVPGFPVGAAPVPGHNFEVVIGTIDDVPVILYPGRVHLYQGYNVAQVCSLVRHAHHLGCRTMIFAAASGAVPGRAPLGLGLITDQLNLTGQNPLIDPEDLRDVDTPFVDMSDAYTPYLRSLCQAVARDERIQLTCGVLAGITGPSFESPAEVRAMELMGANFTAMSVVNEVIMAHALGMNVLGLTVSANAAGAPSVSHETVLAYAKAHQDDFAKLMRGVLGRL